MNLVREGWGASWRTVAMGLGAGFAIALEVLWCAAAQAGAFNLPEGQGLAIVDVTFEGGTRYFDGLGKMTTAPRFGRGDLSAYGEYGVTDWLMAVLQADLTAVSLKGNPSARYEGLGPSMAGAQVQVLAVGPAVAAVQASFRIPGTVDRRNRALLGDTARSAEVRALFGLTFTMGDWPAFIDLQTAFRLRDQGAPDEIHTDVTLGVRPLADLLLMLQAFDTTDIGRATAWFPHQRFTHVGVAAVYDLDESWSVELAGYTTILGQRSLREQGLTSAVWYRF